MFLSRIDRLVIYIFRAAGLVVGSIVLLIFGFLLIESFPVISSAGLFSFFQDTAWLPLSQQFDMVPMILGSLYCVTGALVIAVPVGIGTAIYMTFYAPIAIQITLQRMLETLGGIPSVVFGLWGLMVLVPLINQVHAPGASLLAAILVLSFMISPLIVLMSLAAFREVNDQQIQQAISIGLSRSTIIYKIILPITGSRLLTGCILQTGRAFGETIAVLMVCGNVVQNPESIFSPIRTLTANIALETAYAMDNHRSALFVSGLILLTLVSLLLLSIDVIERKKSYAETA